LNTRRIFTTFGSTEPPGFAEIGQLVADIFAALATDADLVGGTSDISAWIRATEAKRTDGIRLAKDPGTTAHTETFAAIASGRTSALIAGIVVTSSISANLFGFAWSIGITK
jgi:hypothetical protein